jgi:hypothetical protein
LVLRWLASRIENFCPQKTVFPCGELILKIFIVPIENDVEVVVLDMFPLLAHDAQTLPV